MRIDVKQGKRKIRLSQQERKTLLVAVDIVGNLSLYDKSLLGTCGVLSDLTLHRIADDGEFYAAKLDEPDTDDPGKGGVV